MTLLPEIIIAVLALAILIATGSLAVYLNRELRKSRAQLDQAHDEAGSILRGNEELVEALSRRDKLIRKCEVLLSPFLMPDFWAKYAKQPTRPDLAAETELVLAEYRKLMAEHANCRQLEVQVELAKQHDATARSINAFCGWMEEHFPAELKQARESNTPMFELVQDLLLRSKRHSPQGWFTLRDKPDASALSSAHTEGPES